MKKQIITFAVFAMLFIFAESAYSQAVIGLAFKKMPAPCSFYREALGFTYKVDRTNNSTVAKLKEEVRKELEAEYDEPILFYNTSEKFKNGVILSFNHTWSGTSCRTKIYVAGFGETFAEARTNAERAASYTCKDCTTYLEEEF